MSKPSLLERIRPGRPRSRTIPWPFPVEGETPKITVRVLGAHEIEEAHFAVVDHYKGHKRPVKEGDGVFEARIDAELVRRAITEAETGAPIAETTDALMREPPQLVRVLQQELVALQRDVAPVAFEQPDFDRLIEELKKNTPEAALGGLPLSSLNALITTLVARLPSSTPASGSGS